MSMEPLNIPLPPSSIHGDVGRAYFSHQIATAKALESCDVVMNDNPTGSGKTKASLLWLKEIKERMKRARKRFYTVMYVAPINSLLSQLLDDIREFLQDEGMRDDYIVFPVMSRTINMIKDRLGSEGENYTNGDILSMLMEGSPYLNRVVSRVIKEDIGHSDHDIIDEKRPCILVINPDILYHVMFSDYYHKQKQNIHVAMLKHVKYCVFDEFHYYDLFQLNSFISLVSAWSVFGKLGDHDGATKLCLLSATPNDQLKAMLERTAVRVSTVNESTIGKTGNEMIPFLAPVTLHVHQKDETRSFAYQLMNKTCSREALESYLQDGKWGAIICNSMNHANKIFHYYNTMMGKQYPMERITGTITQEKRREAVNARVLMTTNTVDIGFNFKRDKEFTNDRQNIDFLFIDFANHDEMVQRLGRAGRVLGKTETSIPSDVHVFLDHADWIKVREMQECHAFDGKTRDEILELLKPVTGERDYGTTLFKQYGYFIAREFVDRLRQWNVVERWREHKDDEVDAILTRLEETMKSIYLDGASDRSTKRLKMLHDRSKSKDSFHDLSLKQQSDFTYHYITDSIYRPLGGSNGLELLKIDAKNAGVDAGVIQDRLYDELTKKRDESTIRQIMKKYNERDIASYYQYTRSFFSSIIDNFRGDEFIDSMNHKIVITDEHHHLSSSTTYSYNLFHVIHYYDYALLEEKTWMMNGRKRSKTIIGLRKPLESYRPVTLELYIPDVNITKESFEKALFNMLYIPPSRANDLTFRCEGAKIPTVLKDAIKDGIFGYLLPEFYAFKTRTFSLPLHVSFRDGTKGSYALFTGKNALEMRSKILGMELKK